MTEVTMTRTKQPVYKRPTYQELKAKTGRVQTGALIDSDVWQAMRVQAVAETRTLGALLDDACRLYLRRAEKREERQ